MCCLDTGYFYLEILKQVLPAVPSYPSDIMNYTNRMIYFIQSIEKESENYFFFNIEKYYTFPITVSLL